MGILDTSASKKITVTFLKSIGLYRSYWGSPAGRKPSGKLYWCKNRKFYEGFWTGNKDNLSIYWFPKGFEGHVSQFHGSAPAGTLMITPQISDDKVIIYSNIFTEMDFLLIKTQLTKKYKLFQYTDEGVF